MNEKANEIIEYAEELDTRGLYCPEPLFEVRHLSETLKTGQCFKVLADDPAAEEDLKRWAKRTESKIVEFRKELNGDLIFIFKKMK